MFSGVVLPQLKQRGKRCQILPNESLKALNARDKYPECLVLGPKQQEIIDCVEKGSDRILIRGEAGCGKTLVLLAILFRHRGKCLGNVGEKNYRKVMFAIPKQKKEFVDWVQRFVDDYCDSDRVILHLIESSAERLHAEKGVHLILVDEFNITDIAFIASFFKEVERQVKICVASLLYRASLLQRRSGNEKPLEYLKKWWTSFFLQNSYRCPVNVQIRCAKIRRAIHQESSTSAPIISHSPLSIGFQHGVNVIHEDAIKVIQYKEDLEEICKQIPAKQLKGEQMLAVLYGVEIENCNALNDYKQVKIEHDEFFQMCEDFLSFTGVEYHTVTFIVSPLKLFSNGKTKVVEREINIELCLYQSLSRALNRVFIICHEENYEYFTNLLSLDQLDVRVFEKLRRKQKVAPEDLDLLISDEDKREALKILLITKSFDQFMDMKHIFKGNSRLGMETIFYQHCFVNRHQSDSLEMLLSIVNVIGTPQNLDFVKVYIFLAQNMTDLENVAYHRKNILPLLKRTFQCSNTSPNINLLEKVSTYLKIQAAAICWHDFEVFEQNLNKIKAIMTSIVKVFIQLYQRVPDYLLWIYHEENFMNRSDGEKMFEKFSTVENVGSAGMSSRMIFDFSDIKMACFKFCNPFQINFWESYSEDPVLMKFFGLSLETVVYYEEDNVFCNKEVQGEILECCRRFKENDQKVLCNLIPTARKLLENCCEVNLISFHFFLNSFRQLKILFGKLE